MVSSKAMRAAFIQTQEMTYRSSCATIHMTLQEWLTLGFVLNDLTDFSQKAHTCMHT